MLFAGRVAASLVLLIAVPNHTFAAQKAATSSGLTIVVIEGEDAINVIQQKTAVAPIIEVRDRNNQPVSGATVRFAIQGGRATFSGAKTLTLTTNAAGRAAVTGLTPTGSGALQITASATFEGQTAAAVTIAQTNVATAAQAAGGAAAGAGGGISATTIGIVAGSVAAVAGGAIAAKQVLGAGGVSIYEGDFRIDSLQTVQQVQQNGVINLTCTISISQSGEVRGEIEERGDGTLVGTMSAKWNIVEGARTCPTFGASGGTDVSYGKATVTGTAASFQASSQYTSSDGIGFGAQSFSGTLSNGVIRGTWTLGPSGYKGTFGGGAISPPGSVAVTLTK